MLLRKNKENTILVTGASGIVGYGILKSLKNENCKLIGTTIYDTGATYCVIFDNWVSANRFMLLGSYVNSISKIYIYK